LWIRNEVEQGFRESKTEEKGDLHKEEWIETMGRGKGSI
jgi:hypothetical protein